MRKSKLQYCDWVAVACSWLACLLAASPSATVENSLILLCYLWVNSPFWSIIRSLQFEYNFFLPQSTLVPNWFQKWRLVVIKCFQYVWETKSWGGLNKRYSFTTCIYAQCPGSKALVNIIRYYINCNWIELFDALVFCLYIYTSMTS